MTKLRLAAVIFIAPLAVSAANRQSYGDTWLLNSASLRRGICSIKII
jgi:hypothetical protein